MDETTHAFVIRLWKETTGDDPDRPTWRGYIDHVGSGRRYHLNRLEDILPFIVQHLATSTGHSPTTSHSKAGEVEGG